MFVVAGVTGKVGQVVANELLEKKQPTKVIVRDAGKAHEWSKRGAEVAVGSLEDPAFLATALKGAKGFFTLLPPNFAAPDFYAYQRKLADTIGQAVKISGVPHVVILSSVGADLDSGNGPIRGLNYLENVIRGTGATLTAIRAGYFQENVMNSVEPAKMAGIFPNFTPSADYPMPMVATKDIGMLAAQQLIARPTKAEVIDLHGPSYSINQVAEKLGTALNKKLNVVDIPEAGHVDAMVKSGFPKQVAEVFADMYKGFASGKITPKGDRLVQGSTTLDDTIKGLGLTSAPAMNVVGWFEIPVRDMARSTAFYEHILQLKLSAQEMGPVKMAWFPMAQNVPGSAGSLVKGEGFEPSNKGSIVYFSVNSIEETLARVKDKGGKVLQQKTAIGQWGFVAHFEDSEGNRVALHAAK